MRAHWTKWMKTQSGSKTLANQHSMKAVVIFVSLTIVLSLSLLGVTLAQTAKASAPKTSTKTNTAGPPIKVLLRVREGIPMPGNKVEAMFSATGMFIMKVMAIEDSKPGYNLASQLKAGGRIVVENDSITDQQKQTWKFKAEDYDFVVTWVRNWERMQSSSDPLGLLNLLCKPERMRLAVGESWVVDKPSDPSIKNSWQTSEYKLTGPLTYPNSTACMFKTGPSVTNAFVESQIRNVILPARKPVLVKALALITANRAKKP